MKKKKVSTNEAIKLERKYGAHNYKPLPVVLKKGKGVRLQRYKGETLLDAMIFSQNPFKI